MIDAPALRSKLAARMLPTGGWGYVVGQPAHPEPTCLTLLALGAERDRFAAAIDGGFAALERCRGSDGAYRWPHGRTEAAWPTALSLFTRAVLTPADLKPTVERLRTLRGRILRNDPEVADMIDIDVSLVGWSWAEGNFSWVEPTAWAVLGLRRAGADVAEIGQGMRLLLDRAFDTGGINYGNRKVLGRMTEPIPTPTALMLLATQGLIDQPRIEAALTYLRHQADSSTDLEHLSWARLAFSAWRDQPEVGEAIRRTDVQLRRVLSEAPDPPLTVRLALAALALDADRHFPFQLTDQPRLDLAADRPTDSSAVSNRGWLGQVVSRLRGVFANSLNQLRPPPASSAVHIGAAPDYDGNLVAILQQQFNHFRDQVPMAGRRVVVKPNLVEYHRDRVINTDPRVIGAVIELCRAEGAAEIIVAEGPGHWRNAAFLVEESGLGEVLRRHGVPFVDLNHDEPQKILNLGRLTGLDYLYFARTVVQPDVLISLPKLKTHHWAGATLSLKNLFGTLPGICYGWPKNELHWRGIPQSIVDIALTNTPHLAIVDGIIGMEGDGPLNGTAKPMGVLVMGTDLLAVDATCCRLMGIDPLRVPYLVLARHKKLGRIAEAEIPQLGEAIASRAQVFELPPRIEKHLLAHPA